MRPGLVFPKTFEERMLVGQASFPAGFPRNFKEFQLFKFHNPAAVLNYFADKKKNLPFWFGVPLREVKMAYLKGLSKDVDLFAGDAFTAWLNGKGAFLIDKLTCTVDEGILVGYCFAKNAFIVKNRNGIHINLLELHFNSLPPFSEKLDVKCSGLIYDLIGWWRGR